MAELDRITIDPNVCLAQPTIRGMRITVGATFNTLAAGKAPPARLAGSSGTPTEPWFTPKR